MPADAQRLLIRAYEPGDEAAILGLFARCFHQPMTIETWRWRYEDNPRGKRHISVAFAGAALAGHYAGYPVLFDLSEEEVSAHQIGDTMTDPGVRQVGRGPTSVLARTAEHFYQTWCERRVAFNYGFNVSNIQKFSVRFLRAEVVEPVRYRVRDLRRRPLPRLSRAERWLRGVTLEVVSKLPPDWDDFYGRCARHYRFLVRRDSEYVGWRYFRSPGRYEVVTIRKWGVLAGWFVFRVRDDVMRIGDMLLDPDLADVFEYGLRHLSAVLPVNVIETWCPPRPRWLSNLLTELAFDDRPEPQDLSVMCVPFTRPDAAQLLRSELFYTMGDSDLF